jgi:outer membrane protein OmpA-like peptidoglycan-associated protein
MSTRARPLFLSGLLVAVFIAPFLRADPTDVDGSRDYPGLPRIPGFVITDYNEDNSAGFDFPVAHPTSIDADNVDTVRVKGHRYVIRYETPENMQAPSLLQIQQYYEKLAKSEGFTVAKSGAVHDVTETFHLTKGGHELWVYLDPSITIDIITIVEGGNGEILPPVARASTPPPPPLPSLVPPVVTTAPEVPGPIPGLPGQLDEATSATPLSASDLPLPTETGESTPATTSTPTSDLPLPTQSGEATPAPAVSDDSLYSALKDKGRVALPVTFLSGRPDLDVNSAPVIVNVIALLQKHPDLQLEIDGFTDNTGDPQSNQRLSAQRAATVRDLLVAGHIPESRLVANGLGGSEPVADNDTPEGREKNRRIELAVLTEPPPATVLAQEAPAEQALPDPVVAEESVVKESPPRKTAQDDSATDDSPTFHAPAPNGVNYYPPPDQ